MTYNVLDFGAVGNGSDNDGAAIQSAIDKCSSNGGGRVLLPGGKVYRSGSLVLRSHVELHLEMGAVLKGSDCLEDYNLFQLNSVGQDALDVPTYENCDYTGRPSLFFLYAKDCEDVAITGLGRIDGNEEIFYGRITPWHIDGEFYPRVPLLFLENITHLSLLQVTLTGSAFWTTHMVGCSDVLIDSIHILNNLRLANCDGIDPDHCKNVRIVNCHIETADDCIVFKNTAGAQAYGPCENIVVANCTLISTSAAIKFGTESEAPFRNFVVQNCNISRTNRGISLQLRDGGCIENVTFSNLNIGTRLFSREHWWGAAEPIAITAVKRREDTRIGCIRNIRFQNINCSGENGILIYGDESCNISDVHFDGITLELHKETDWTRDDHDLRPAFQKTAVKDGLYALYVRNASDITFRDVKMRIASELQEDGKEPVSIENCRNIVWDKNGQHCRFLFGTENTKVLS